VFKENLALSAMGTVFGLGLGKLLLDFVMSQVKIDMVWFDSRILWPSVIWSVVLTILTAFVVDFIFYFRLEKINMAEALKSVE
jgi:putative ABC transport system permease protein